MPLRLIDSLTTTEPLAEIFSDSSVLAAMLDFEVALAHAEARLKIIPSDAAETIAACAHPAAFDAVSLARAAPLAGTPAVPVVEALIEAVRKKDPAGAGFVHWGSTSQDVSDTALVLLLKKAQPVLGRDFERLEVALHRMSREHRHTVMLARTLLQPAPPTTFGLKTAGWLAAIHRCRRRLHSAFDEALILEFGGASGTLAALGNQGIAVGKLVADELGLAFPEAPWHAHRDRLAALVCACGVLGGALGKMARDVSLLTEHGISELAEPAAPGRGRSSSMPHKRNPVGCSVALAAVNRLAGLICTFLSGMPQEHERGLGGWQAEWPMVASTVQAVGAAAAAMAEVAEGLVINPVSMRRNIDLTRGVIFGERAVTLSKKIGRDQARGLIEQATRTSIEQSRRLSDVLGEMPEVTGHLDRADLDDLENPEQYLGMAEEFQERLLASTEESFADKPDPKKE
jgi:3-carboxy-cis,cis-muconate cycloisomerase